MERLVNANYGIVRSVSHNRERIKIIAPRGGIFECQNAGFEIGQAVCFILDILGQQILKVLPKEIADLQLIAGLNPKLQEAMQKKPIDNDVTVEDDIALMEDINNAINRNSSSNGYSTEEYFDIISRMDGESPPRRNNDT